MAFKTLPKFVPRLVTSTPPLKRIIVSKMIPATDRVPTQVQLDHPGGRSSFIPLPHFVNTDMAKYVSKHGESGKADVVYMSDKPGVPSTLLVPSAWSDYHIWEWWNKTPHAKATQPSLSQQAGSALMRLVYHQPPPLRDIKPIDKSRSIGFFTGLSTHQGQNHMVPLPQVVEDRKDPDDVEQGTPLGQSEVRNARGGRF